MAARILVVDDSATVRRVVSRTLTGVGHDVRLAVDGRDALAKLEGWAPDLVLTDFVMPHMNGLRFVQAMREIANLRAVPVILMSAKADKIGSGFLAQTRAVDAITKPFSPEALLAVTEHALRRRAEPSGPGAPPPSDETDLIALPPEPELPETSAALLEATARTIAERLARGLGEPAVATMAERLEPAELFALVDDLARLLPGRDGESAFEGRIEHAPLGDILQLLTHQRQSGVLEVVKSPPSRRKITICLKDGMVSLALGDAQETEFRLGRYLLREELIERETLERILRHRGETRGSLLGTLLVKLGYISTDELSRVLVQQTSELIYEALRWPRGTYRFLRFATRPEALDASLQLPLASVLMEGLRRVDEWRLIEEQIRSFDDVPHRNEHSLALVDLDGLSPDERRVFESIDGARTVREIVEHVRMGSFDACKILFQLTSSRLIRIERTARL